MKRFALAWVWFAAGFVSPLVWAQAAPAQSEGLQWLQRVSSAAQKLNFSGTFVYRNGTRSETSRIIHLVSNGNQMEKLEVLDGSPREVIRNNDEVSCYLPESRLVIIEQRSVRRGFPALLSGGLAGLNDHYLIRKGNNARVAGFDSQIIRLEPRDTWRYGHRLWVDIGSGLLLKADIFDERGEALESMAFTDLRIGESIRPEALKPSYAASARESWKVRQAKLSDLRDDAPWVFRTDLPGFRKQVALRRSLGKDGADLNMLHWVFSDGLVALSVFISPLRPPAEGGEESFQTMGALSVVKRVVDGHQLVVMGDLPPAALKHFAEGVGVRSE
ncbi:MAG: MucB/RseB C-terminal domain-containing protein [Pseudomonadota bacterium]